MIAQTGLYALIPVPQTIYLLTIYKVIIFQTKQIVNGLPPFLSTQPGTCQTNSFSEVHVTGAPLTVRHSTAAVAPSKPHHTQPDKCINLFYHMKIFSPIAAVLFYKVNKFSAVIFYFFYLLVYHIFNS